MPYKEKEITKIFYSIGEVAGRYKVNTSLIRFWEKEFDIIKPSKNKKGNRLFTIKDLENFDIIFRLVKKEGYTLDGAKKALVENKKDLTLHNDIKRSLEKIRSELMVLKSAI
ncbi:MAG: MerR family transcriptional regulator [Flavobacteriales bacterium]|nr:MerR family transcriptional regulator [Flavobacteriales bacterium]